MAIESFEEAMEVAEKSVWDTEKVFRPVSEWDEDIGPALFFKIDAGEPPEVTSPLYHSFDYLYFTHWMRLPKEFGEDGDYRLACIKSGIETSIKNH